MFRRPRGTGNELERLKQTLTQQHATTQAALDAQKTITAAYLAAKDAHTVTLERLNATIDALEAEVTALKAEVATVEEERDNALAELDKAYARIGEYEQCQ